MRIHADPWELALRSRNNGLSGESRCFAGCSGDGGPRSRTWRCGFGDRHVAWPPTSSTRGRPAERMRRLRIELVRAISTCCRWTPPPSNLQRRHRTDLLRGAFPAPHERYVVGGPVPFDAARSSTSRKKLDPNWTPRPNRPSGSESQKLPICSTFLRSGRQDLNLRPPGPQPGALPDCATPRGMRSSGRRESNPP